jgi:thioredoxin 1
MGHLNELAFLKVVVRRLLIMNECVEIIRPKERVMMSELMTEVGDSNFEREVLGSDKPVLVDFWATWCGPCRVLAPVLETVAEKYAASARVVKVDVDENSSLTQRYGIKGMPTLVLFKDGREQERVVGVVSATVISRMIDKHLVSATSAGGAI